jgi:hypothetical protein
MRRSITVKTGGRLGGHFERRIRPQSLEEFCELGSRDLTASSLQFRVVSQAESRIQTVFGWVKQSRSDVQEVTVVIVLSDGFSVGDLVGIHGEVLHYTLRSPTEITKLRRFESTCGGNNDEKYAPEYSIAQFCQRIIDGEDDNSF